MADKAGGRRPAGQDLGASSPDRIRNVVLIGPGGSGKTTLVETLLASAGAIPRAGTIQEGSTVCDFEDSEKAHERSISLADRAGHPSRGPRSTSSTPPGTPTSSVRFVPDSGRRTARCS